MKILHVEDSELDSELAQSLLKQDGIECEMVRVENREDFFEAVQNSKFDLILSDCTLPRFHGLEALELAHVLHPEIPFIFFSGTIGEESAIESLRNGATDYVLKDRSAKLPSSVRRALTEAAEQKVVSRLKRALNHNRRKEIEESIVSGMSRHFNNILVIIRGHASLLAENILRPEKVTDSASAMEVAALRGMDIIQHLLAYAGRCPLNLALTDLNLEVAEILERQRKCLPGSIEIVTELGKNLFPIHLDPVKLEEIVSQVLHNAVTAIPSGGRIRVSTNRVEGAKIRTTSTLLGDEPYLCLSVVDTGSGMDDETLRRSFQPFYTTRIGQNGLGLCVVQGLMKSHRGVVDIQSEVGIGTVVSLYFPISHLA